MLQTGALQFLQSCDKVFLPLSRIQLKDFCNLEIVNALWALFMKMQVSVSEATACMKKVIGGGQMGNWFENMEHMDIQAERAATKKAQEEAEKAQAEAEKAQAELKKAQAEIEKLRTELKQAQDPLKK